MNDVKTQDFDGVELLDLETARGEAQKDIDEIKQTHFNSLGDDWSGWSIEIRDPDGALLLVLPFSRN
jgi:hypothetical protein